MSALTPTEPLPQVASSSEIATFQDTAAAESIDNAPINMSSKQSKTYSRRVVLHTTATAAELMAGKQLEIPDAERIFKPDFSSSEKDMKAMLENVDTSKGIITEVQVMSLYSNAPAPVNMGMKMFQRTGSSRQASCEDLKVTNEAGWLYSCNKSAVGQEASHSRNNYINILALQPFERTRIPTGMSVYKPNNVMNNRMISEYGAYVRNPFIFPFVKRRHH